MATAWLVTKQIPSATTMEATTSLTTVLALSVSIVVLLYLKFKQEFIVQYLLNFVAVHIFYLFLVQKWNEFSFSGRSIVQLGECNIL
jgi:hypothetical protein